MNLKARSILIERIRLKINPLVSYQRFANECGLNLRLRAYPPDREIIKNVLEEISIFESKAGRPMLSAIVVKAYTFDPGKGFYELAKLVKPNITIDKYFALREQNKCLAFWKNDNNYKEFL